MVLDYHMHTPRCKHATGAPAEYAARAAERGLAEIGFSDHSPMPPGFDDSWRMAPEELDGYVAEVLALRDTWRGRLTVRLGLEADFAPGTEEFMRAQLARHPFDYVIGSVHYLDGWNFDHDRFKDEFDRRDVCQVYEKYFHAVAAMARTRLFDIVGHIDLIKKWGYRPKATPTAAIRDALDAVAEAGMAIELNTSGLRRPCREIYPSPEILGEARGRGIPIVTSSDAHRPEEVGLDLDRALALARETGYREIARFDGRRHAPVALT